MGCWALPRMQLKGNDSPGHAILSFSNDRQTTTKRLTFSATPNRGAIFCEEINDVVVVVKISPSPGHDPDQGLQLLSRRAFEPGVSSTKVPRPFHLYLGLLADSDVSASCCDRIQVGVAPVVNSLGAFPVSSVGAARRCGLPLSSCVPGDDFCSGFFSGQYVGIAVGEFDDCPLSFLVASMYQCGSGRVLFAPVL